MPFINEIKNLSFPQYSIADKFHLNIFFSVNHSPEGQAPEIIFSTINTMLICSVNLSRVNRYLPTLSIETNPQRNPLPPVSSGPSTEGNSTK